MEQNYIPINNDEWVKYNEWYNYQSYYNSYYNNSYVPPHKRNTNKKKIKLNSFKDLVYFSNNTDKYYCKNIDIETLRRMKYSLNKLNNMVGLEKIKEQIYLQLLFFLQRLDNENNDMLHTIIEGEPGLGKTELANILGELYSCLRNFNKFYNIKRSDLVAEYLGQTAIKTQKKLEECRHGIIFIDEAYSLGNNTKSDSYSKEAIDTLNSFLSENKKDIICIIAGYKDELQKCFFNNNKGLERRFPWKYTIDKYDSKELYLIFKYITDNQKWKLDNSINESFFEKNYDLFKNNGGDCEILFQKSKLIYSKNRINNKQKKYKLLSINDLNECLEIINHNEQTDTLYTSMYS